MDRKTPVLFQPTPTSATPTIHTDLKQSLLQPIPYRQLKYLIFVVSMLCLAPFYYGFSLTYISTISPLILYQFFGEEAGNSVMIGMLIGIFPIGAGVGAIFAPFFMNFLSRKNFLLFFNAVAILIAGLLQINQLQVLFVCKFMQGFIVGNYMGVTPIYIKQLTPVCLRGSIGAMSQFFIIGGVVICYALGLIFQVAQVNHQFFWRFMFSITAITVIIQSILLILKIIPQSPSSLIEAGQLKKSRKVLALFNAEFVLDNVFAQYIKLSRRNKFKITYRKKQSHIRKAHSLQNEVQLCNSANHPLVFSVKDDSNIKLQKKSSILINPSYNIDLHKKQSQSSNSYTIDIQTELSKKNSERMEQNNQHAEQRVKISIKAFIIGFQIPLMQQFSGVKTIVTEIGVILSSYDAQLALYTPLLANIIQFIATGFSILVLAHYGRRPIILLGNAGVAICSLVVAGFFLGVDIGGQQGLVFGALAFIFIFMIIYGLTIGPAVWLYIPEIIPPKIVPLATFMNWLGVSISVIVTPIVIKEVGSPYPLFFFFGGISTIFFIINYLFVVETKGLQPSQIAQKLA